MRPLGSTARCALAVKAYRLLLDRQLRQPPPVERMARLERKLDALVAAFTPAERAYYVDQVWMLGAGRLTAGRRRSA